MPVLTLCLSRHEREIDMKVRLAAYTITEVNMFGIELDVPDSVVSQGHDALEAWCKANKDAINSAKCAHTESEQVVQVTGIGHVERL